MERNFVNCSFESDCTWYTTMAISIKCYKNSFIPFPSFIYFYCLIQNIRDFFLLLQTTGLPSSAKKKVYVSVLFRSSCKVLLGEFTVSLSTWVHVSTGAIKVLPVIFFHFRHSWLVPWEARIFWVSSAAKCKSYPKWSTSLFMHALLFSTLFWYCGTSFALTLLMLGIWPPFHMFSFCRYLHYYKLKSTLCSLRYSISTVWLCKWDHIKCYCTLLMTLAWLHQHSHFQPKV